MASNKAVWGIEIGNCALKAIKLRPAADKQVEAAAIDYIEHPKILSQPDADRTDLIKKALEKFLSRNDITNDEVVVSVPGQFTLARFSKLPPADPKKIPEIVVFEAGQQIPFDMDEVIWDYQTFSEPDSPEVEVGIFAIKRELINSHMLHFDQAGIEPSAVQSGPLALYNAMAYEKLLGDETTIIIDIGTENTDLLIGGSGSLWTRTIPLGGNNFTEALVKSFKLSFGKAEALKRQAGEKHKYARQIFQAMRPVFADLVAELQRSIGFYTSAHRDAKLERIMAMGNAFKLPGLQKYLQQNLGIDVTRPEKYPSLAATPATSNPEFAQNLTSFGVAYGLALQGLDLAPITSNLLPPEIARAVVWRKKQLVFGAVAACFLLAAVVIWARYFLDKGALAASEGKPVPGMTLESARNALAAGIPSDIPPRQAASMAVAIAETFEREYQQHQDTGRSEITEMDNILDLLRVPELPVSSRDLWIAILDAIHRSFPQGAGTLSGPQLQLASAKTPEEYLGVIQQAGGALDRRKREEIHVLKFDTEYRDNVNSVLLSENRNKDRDEALQTDPDVEAPGYLVTLICRTPNEGRGGYVTTSLIKNLRQNGRKPGLGFYINRVALEEGQAVSPGGKPINPYLNPNLRGGRSGRGAGVPGGSPSVASQSEKTDPLTREPIDNDWQFTIRLDVVLGEPPEVAAPAAKEPSADQEEEEPRS